MKKSLSILFALLIPAICFAQYPPPAGLAGSTAIHKDSSIILGWATGCTLSLGPVDISSSSPSYPTVGNNLSATGMADNSLVSLGDGGVAVLGFAAPIANGPGFDFAVFENGFSNDFLELAFVEVSSDGQNFFRFPSVSLTSTDIQVGSFGSLDATKIDGLAGKYRVEYGTPFDLDQMSGISGLNINYVIAIRIIDVVGCVDSLYATYDSQGNIVNDPWPTAFPSSGFDLDAVAVLNDSSTIGIDEVDEPPFLIFPVPADDRISIRSLDEIQDVRVYTLDGKILLHLKNTGRSSLDINCSEWNAGIYFIVVDASSEKLIVK